MKPLKYALFGLLAAAVAHIPALAQPTPVFNNPPPNAIRVLATAAIRPPIDAVMAEAEKAIGKPIVIIYGSARGNMRTTILNDTTDFDVALLVPDVDVELLKAGKIKPRPREIARAPIAIAIRGDKPADLDLTTNAGIRRAFINAKGVKYSPTGAALFTVRKILDTLNLRPVITDLSTMPGTVVLNPGEYEINIYPHSEIIPNKNVQDQGLVIQRLQVPADITASISTKTRDPAGAQALVDFWLGPTIDPHLAPVGMVKGRRGR